MMSAASWQLPCLFLLFLSCYVCPAEQSTQIRIDPDGGYTGIVIKINKDVPEDLCPQILSNIKVLLRESSRALYSALDQRAFFKSVTIVVPSSWRDSKCQTIIRPPRGGTPYRNADILIAQKHPVHGDEPYTQQSGRCGQPGDGITLPYSFITHLNYSMIEFGHPAKLFVKEWAKLRYGIFDEFGFIHDAMYPSFFHSNGQILPTGTANVQLEGVWINMMTGHTGCNPTHEPGCLFYPNEKQTQEVDCSLGSLHFLPNSTRFCNSKQIAISGPTKHGILCEGKSAQEVIDSHPDFSKNKQINTGNIDPIFEVVRQPEQQYVLVIETSSSMDKHGQWKWINKAAQKFIRYDIPINSNLAIVTFSNSSKVEHSMVQVHSDQVRARLADTIPDKYHLSRSDKRCVLCAMQKVIHEVVSDHKAGTHIVLVTQGGSDTLSLTDENILKGHVVDYNIKMSAIVMPETTSSYLPFYDQITHLMGGQTHLVNFENSIMDFYVNLNEAYANVLHSDARYPTEVLEMVHKEAFVGQTGVSSGNFLIDSTLGRDTQFGIYVEDEEDHLIKSIRFTDSKGKAYGPFHRMSSDFDLINFKTINFPAGQSPPFSAPNQIGMTWQYTIEWHEAANSINSERKSIVLVTSKPRSQSEDQLITVKAWTSDMTEDGNPAEIILSAQVLKGDSPVIGAKVMATVTLESTNNGSIVTLPPIRLHDNGYGDPDIIAGDGIYTRYLGHYLDAGRYRFNIVVDDNDNNAFYVLQDKSDLQPPPKMPANLTEVNYGDLYYTISAKRKCCGSSTLPSLELDKNPSRVERTGIFRRSTLGPVVHIKNPLKANDDKIPPSRIGDLKIRHLPGSSLPDRLIAEWTSPGGDFDEGSVASYRFVFSSDIQELLNPNGQPEVLLGFDRMERAGTAAKFDFNFPHYDKDFYVGAYGFDIAGNRGKISNLVHVKVLAPQPVKSQEAVPIRSLNAEEDFEPNWIIIGSICGVISILFIMAILSIAYCIYVSKKKSTKTGSTSSVIGVTSSDETDSSSFDSDIKNIMSNPLGPALALPRNNQMNVQQQSTPPSQVTTPMDTNSTNVTPVYWSASQLLSKLDHHSQGYYVPAGPQSLQLPSHHQMAPPGRPPAHHGPVSLHNMSYEARPYHQPWSYTNRSQNIPEEYTITVEDSSMPPPRSVVNAKSGKVPPPVMPKPRNVSQV